MRLRQAIIDGEFELGEALSESKIAKLYDVSRTPVREAFAFLGLEGLVITEPQQGTYVFTITQEDFALVSKTRSVLETAALEMTLERKRTQLLKEWRRIVKAMATALERQEPVTYVQLDRDFHAMLFHFAGNPYLLESTSAFSAKIAAIQSRLSSTMEHMAHSFAEHSELLRYVEDKRDQSALELLDHHIRFKGKEFWDAAAKQFEIASPRRGATDDTGRRTSVV